MKYSTYITYIPQPTGPLSFILFFFNDPAPTEIYTLSLHDALPIGTATRYMLNHAHREAEQLGHYRVDPLHMLLALLYKDSTPTAESLEKAGVTFYALRQ